MYMYRRRDITPWRRDKNRHSNAGIRMQPRILSEILRCHFIVSFRTEFSTIARPHVHGRTVGATEHKSIIQLLSSTRRCRLPYQSIPVRTSGICLTYHIALNPSWRHSLSRSSLLLFPLVFLFFFFFFSLFLLFSHLPPSSPHLALLFGAAVLVFSSAVRPVALLLWRSRRRVMMRIAF